MAIPYDSFAGAFLAKISEFDLMSLDYDEDRTAVVDGYMKAALSLSTFKKVCKYDFATTGNDVTRVFDVDIDENVVDEIVDIISEGMVVQWLKPYVYKQENLENTISTRDYSFYSPAELLRRVGGAYEKAQKDYIQLIREFSYNHGDLTDLHI